MHIRAPCKLRKQERRDRVVARLTYTFPFPGMDQVQFTVYQLQSTRYSGPGTVFLIPGDTCSHTECNTGWKTRNLWRSHQAGIVIFIWSDWTPAGMPGWKYLMWCKWPDWLIMAAWRHMVACLCHRNRWHRTKSLEYWFCGWSVMLWLWHGHTVTRCLDAIRQPDSMVGYLC